MHPTAAGCSPLRVRDVVVRPSRKFFSSQVIEMHPEASRRVPGFHQAVAAEVAWVETFVVICARLRQFSISWRRVSHTGCKGFVVPGDHSAIRAFPCNDTWHTASGYGLAEKKQSLDVVY